jgi:hypothetical protein
MDLESQRRQEQDTDRIQIRSRIQIRIHNSVYGSNLTSKDPEPSQNVTDPDPTISMCT